MVETVCIVWHIVCGRKLKNWEELLENDHSRRCL
jgi:hypothetical protein